jgi:hypothetical protein
VNDEVKLASPSLIIDDSEARTKAVLRFNGGGILTAVAYALSCRQPPAVCEYARYFVDAV